MAALSYFGMMFIQLLWFGLFLGGTYLIGKRIKNKKKDLTKV